MPSFAEWQAQQGGGGTPPGGGAPSSFAAWQAAQGGGSPPASSSATSPSYAPYDWLQAYDAAQSNIFGEEASKEMIQHIMKDAGPDYQKAVDAGIISGPGGPVDWSKAPKPVGGTPSGNYMTNSVGGRYGFGDPGSGKPTASVTGDYTYDPNYGAQAVVQKRAPNSPEMNALRAGAFSMAAMPIAGMLAPAISSGLGTSAATSNLLANAAVGAGKTALMGGKIDPYTMAGSVAGGMTGIPFGASVGSMAGGMLEGKKPGITPTSAGMTFAAWLANQAANGR